jgi:peptide-N4-(N-acetyl-beta-glucosaminyl)asparagine amidase
MSALVLLLQTKRGRCGEWANAFTMVCCAMGLRARLTLDMTDHVWTEVFIEESEEDRSKGRWVHMDACENLFDAPLVYERGWGKKLNYVFSYHKEGVNDVSLRYTRDFANLKPQRHFATE